jgi:hypothetical protein
MAQVVDRQADQDRRRADVRSEAALPRLGDDGSR